MFDFDFGFELDYVSAVIAFVFWALIVVLIWKFVGGTETRHLIRKVITTVLMLPILYWIVNKQLNK